MIEEIRARATLNARVMRIGPEQRALIRSEKARRPGYLFVLGCADCKTLCIEGALCDCCAVNKTVVNGTRVNVFARDNRQGHVRLGTVEEILKTRARR